MNQYANSIMIFIFEKKLLLFITVIVELPEYKSFS